MEQDALCTVRVAASVGKKEASIFIVLRATVFMQYGVTTVES
jgi:hypothetical protein